MKQRLLHLTLVLLSVLALQAQELNVCTYNVRYKNSSDTDAGNGWNTRRTYLINLVNFQMPDLLGVQEATNAQMNDLKSGLTSYGTIGVGRTDGNTSGEYSAIFYRKERLVLIDHGDFWLSDTPYTPSKGFKNEGGSTTYYRICTWGKFYDKLAGVILYHFNTHLDLDETNRQQSYYLIKQKIQEIANTSVPVIISGDYNAVQTGDAYKLFYNSGFLYDSYDKAKQKFITNGTCPGFNANNYSTVSGDLRRIDHIFVTKNAFTIMHYAALNPCYYSTSGTAEYYERAYSDHSPVFAKLAYKSTVPTIELVTTKPPVVGGVYQLSTKDELLAFSYIVNGIAGFSQNAAAKAVLLDDIDMTGVSCWLPMGTESKPFTGTFDGQGHSIQNLTIKTGKSYSGLFGKTSGATIKDFHISGTLTVAEWSGEHGTVGYAENTTITDVHSGLTITANKANDVTKHIGGIAGSMATNTNINRCSFKGKLNDTGTNTIGGIVGYADQTNNKISNAINYGTIKTIGSSTLTGGILGYVNYAKFKIDHCVNAGSVIGKKKYTGQILGRQVKAMSTLPSDLYYLDGDSLTAFGSGTEESSATGATAVTSEQLASGEICYKLNGDQTEINWYQTLPSSDAAVEADPYPMLDPTHDIVLFTDGVYYNANDPSDIAAPLRKTEEGAAIYNLAGQRINKMQKGINIVNGKKILK